MAWFSRSPVERVSRGIGSRRSFMRARAGIALQGGLDRSTGEVEMLHVGLVLALLSALTTQLGFLLRHRGAVQAPDVEMRHPLRSVVGLFRSKWWTIGYLVAAVA